jgi:hypothetical protein
VRSSTALALVLVACSSRPSSPLPAADGAAHAAAPTGPDAPAPTPVEPKPRLRESAVFVDGVPVGVIKFGELPPTLESIWQEGDDGRKLRRFELYAYLEALGVPMARIREVHLHGGRRVAILKAAVLRRWRHDILFSFTQSSTGKPRVHWGSNKPIPGKTTIDLLKVVAVYVDKAPPVRNPKLLRLEIDGEPIDDGVAYQQGEVRRGVRVYRDGRLVGAIKRKTLEARFLVPGSDVAGDPRWTLVPYLESLGVEWTKVRTIDLIHDDALLKRIPPEALAHAEFSAHLEQGGQILVMPGKMPVEAILLYEHSTPPGAR